MSKLPATFAIYSLPLCNGLISISLFGGIFGGPVLGAALAIPAFKRRLIVSASGNGGNCCGLLLLLPYWKRIKKHTIDDGCHHCKHQTCTRV